MSFKQRLDIMIDLKKIEEMFPLLHAAYKESISIDDSNHASWF
jgi:hypothetical protein